MVLYVVSSKTKNIKVGLAVTKKVGHAVVRNKIRRRLREIIKKQVPNGSASFMALFFEITAPYVENSTALSLSGIVTAFPNVLAAESSSRMWCCMKNL